MAKKFSINTVVVPAKSRSNGMVLEGGVGSVVVNQIGENKNNASTVVNNYITNNYNTASDTYREISIDDLLALPDESKKIGVLYLVYSGGSADSGWSHDSTFLLNGESYPDGTFVTWNITQWEAVSAEVVNVQNTVKMKPLEKTVYIPTQLSSSASFPRIQEFIKDGIELMRLKLYEKSEEGVYEPKSYVSGNKQTHEYSVVVPFAYKEGETYYGGALRAEDYKKLVEGGRDVSFYIDTVIGDNPSNERVPSTKLFVDQLRLMATETVPFIVGGKLWDYYTKSEINIKLGDYVTSSDLSANYYNKTFLDAVIKGLQNSIPTKTSQLSNDSNFATETWVTNKGYVTSTTLTTELAKKADALHYHDCIVNMYSTRPTTANIQKGDGRLYQFKATSSMLEGKPNFDGHILHLGWDNSGGYDNQLFVPNVFDQSNRRLGFRGQGKGIWGDWLYCALTTDIPTHVSQLNNDAKYVNEATIENELSAKEDKRQRWVVGQQSVWKPGYQVIAILSIITSSNRDYEYVIRITGIHTSTQYSNLIYVGGLCDSTSMGTPSKFEYLLGSSVSISARLFKIDNNHIALAIKRTNQYARYSCEVIDAQGYGSPQVEAVSNGDSYADDAVYLKEISRNVALLTDLAKKEDKHDYILVTYQYDNVMTVVGFSDAFSSVEATSPISMRVYIKGSTNRDFVHTWFSRHIMRMRQYRQNVSDGNLTYKDDDSVYSVTIDAGGRYVDIGINGSSILTPSLSGDIVYRQFCFENMGI